MSDTTNETGEDEARREGGPPAAPFVIVGIGASAGGLDALEAMLRRFTLDSMAFIVVQHLAPDQESALPTLLQRWCTLHVVPVADGVRVEPNHIYVITPGVNLAILHGVLHVMPTEAQRPRQPVDFFFRSLAEDRGPLAVGVVLSGTGTDGALGLKAIKAEGGITFVQDPRTARFDGMPLSALDASTADFCLPPEGIADELMAVSHTTYLRRPRAPSARAPRPRSRARRRGRLGPARRRGEVDRAPV